MTIWVWVLIAWVFGFSVCLFKIRYRIHPIMGGGEMLSLFHYFLMTARSVRFCFTLNNWTDVDIQWFEDATMFKYVCYGKEVGENLTPHLQGYFEFPHGSKTSISAAVKKLSDGGLLSRPHLEIAKGNANQCIEYCQKEGSFWDKGEKPKGQGCCMFSSDRIHQVSSGNRTIDSHQTTEAELEDRSLLALGSIRDWEVPMGMGDLPGCIREAGRDQMVVWILGSGLCYYRRFQTIERASVQFYIEPIRPISSLARGEGWVNPVSFEDHLDNIPVLTRSNVGTFGVGWERGGITTEEEIRSCDPIPPTCDEFFGEIAGEQWLMDLCDEIDFSYIPNLSQPN